MKKNIIIAVLSILLVASLTALQYMTERVDAARTYINELENDYPEYIDTTAEGDAYSEWYK